MWEKVCKQVMIGFGFASDLLSGVRLFNQSQVIAMQNQSNCEIPFNAQLKTTLYS